MFELDTETLADADQGTCGGKGSPEGVVEWIATETDYWQFDTLGSSYDTVLYARDCACDGPELGCNDDAGGSESALVLHAERGQRIAFVIDGHAGDKCRAVLNAERVTCPSFELDPASLPTTFTDRGGNGSEAFRYQAESAGLYSPQRARRTCHRRRAQLPIGDREPRQPREHGRVHGRAGLHSVSV